MSLLTGLCLYQFPPNNFQECILVPDWELGGGGGGGGGGLGTECASFVHVFPLPES